MATTKKETAVKEIGLVQFEKATIKVRIVGGLTTTVTFGIFEGSPVFNIVVDEQEALVDE